MSKLIFSVTKIVSKREEDRANSKDFLIHMFREAYTELRNACPGGDLHIRLYVEANSAEEVGAKFEEDK